MLKGGNSLSKESAVFSFDLDESLYFEKGQEVAEMLNISLDPNISIQSFHEYVSIRGVIELQGQYNKLEELEENEEKIHQRIEDNAVRYVESVMDHENDEVEFSHRFPVEISIPANRVSNLDDITVNIDAFDYELPSNNHLILRSTIKIHGIKEDEAIEETEDIEEMSSRESMDTNKDSEHSGGEDRALEREVDFNEEQQEMNFEFDVKTDEESTNKVDDEIEDDRLFFKKTQSLQEFMVKGKELNEEEVDDTEDVSDQNEVEWTEDDTTNFHVEAIASEMDTDRAEQDSLDSLNYLSDMFRNEEEERYTKMRLCIVQQEDTIEAISQRFDVPALQIVNRNRLTDADLTEGQVLYIPPQKK